ncbi:MAG: hypothetical protein ACKOGA_01075 [Planctomycetaceae bacterium]
MHNSRAPQWFIISISLLGVALLAGPAGGTEPRALIEGMQANIDRFNPVVCEWECKEHKAVDISAALAGKLQPSPGEGGWGRWIASANHHLVSVGAKNAQGKKSSGFHPESGDKVIGAPSMAWLSDGTVLLHPSSVSWMHALFSRDEDNFSQLSPASTPWSSFAGFPPLGVLRTELLRHLERGELEAGTSQDMLGRPTETLTRPVGTQSFLRYHFSRAHGDLCVQTDYLDQRGLSFCNLVQEIRACENGGFFPVRMLDLGMHPVDGQPGIDVNIYVTTRLEIVEPDPAALALTLPAGSRLYGSRDAASVLVGPTNQVHARELAGYWSRAQAAADEKSALNSLQASEVVPAGENPDLHVPAWKPLLWLGVPTLILAAIWCRRLLRLRRA